eukprot:COSAG01_NODE_2262_length_8049_cov_29.953213_9_plen_106_part_00
MQTVQTKLLRKEQALVRARTELRALRVKVQAQRAQLERERATVSFLRQSPEEREIESRLRWVHGCCIWLSSSTSSAPCGVPCSCRGLFPPPPSLPPSQRPHWWRC